MAAKQTIPPAKSSLKLKCQTLTRPESGLLGMFEMQQRNQSTVANLKSKQTIFRTDESDPAKHGDIHDGLFYTIPHEIASRLFVLGGFDKEQQLTMKTFRETSIMVRKPALEILSYLKKTDFSKPPNRYVLCKLLWIQINLCGFYQNCLILDGGIGSGKTFTLNHILHYGFNQKFVLLYCGKRKC